VSKISEIREELQRELPAFVFRADPLIQKYTGLTRRTLSNLDAKKQGVRRKIFIGGKVAYLKEDLIDFIISRIQEESERREVHRENFPYFPKKREEEGEARELQSEGGEER